ncbi:MAG: hypothetical protein MK188_06855 [Gammaproteobacteria bacterium]|nr:hypothetical protein [Gammaproteobacteria bacterium]
MKLTETVLELMFELSTIEGVNHFDGNEVDLRNKLLKLFNATRNRAAHDIIIEIMNEAGYPWFATIARAEEFRSPSSWSLEHNKTMSDDEFMDLMPANGRFH